MSSPKAYEDLELISKAIASLTTARRFMLFTELERKVDSERVDKIRRGQLVMVYVPETTRAKERKWPQSYWTLATVYRCSTDTVYVNEVNPDYTPTGLQLKLPRQFAIVLKEPHHDKEVLAALTSIDKSLNVAMAPFTTDPAYYGVMQSAFHMTVEEMEETPWKDETESIMKPSSKRKKRKSRFSLKGRA